MQKRESDISRRMDCISSVKLVSPAYRTRMKNVIGGLNLKKGLMVLEVGSGTGEYSRLAASYGVELVAVDIEKKNLSRALTSGGDGNIHYVLADAQRLPFRDNAFDRAFTTEVLEHVEDDAAAASEMFRVQKPGGAVVIEVPTMTPSFRDPLSAIASVVRGRHVIAIPDRLWGHRRFYTVSTAQKLAAGVGFEVESARYIINPFALAVQMYVPEIVMFYASRGRKRKAAANGNTSQARKYALKMMFKASGILCGIDSFIGGMSHGGVFIKARKPNKNRQRKAERVF